MSEHNLRFSRSLYRLDAIERTAATFAGCGRFEVRSDGEDIVVELRDLHPSLTAKADTIIDEFRNHALHGTILDERNAAAEGA